MNEPTIELEYYTDTHIEHNWKVLIDGKYVGDLHDCDGVGGSLGSDELNESDLFDKACILAMSDLIYRQCGEL